MIELQRLIRNSVFLGLATGIALAQIPSQNFRQTGNLVGASAAITGQNYQANVNISPVTLPGNNQEIYIVNWSTTIYGGTVPQPPPCPLPTDPPPPPPDQTVTTASGYLPISALQKLSGGGLVLDLDVTKIQLLFFGSFHCGSAGCNPIPAPVSFPLKGTFTPFTNGPGAFSSSSSGNRTTLNIDPVCQYVYSFSGNQSDTSARFAGQIGAIPVPAMSVGSNGQLHVQKGQLSQTITCTPPAH